MGFDCKFGGKVVAYKNAIPRLGFRKFNTLFSNIARVIGESE
jgi:hypothetical protein